MCSLPTASSLPGARSSRCRRCPKRCLPRAFGAQWLGNTSPIATSTRCATWGGIATARVANGPAARGPAPRKRPTGRKTRPSPSPVTRSPTSRSALRVTRAAALTPRTARVAPCGSEWRPFGLIRIACSRAQARYPAGEIPGGAKCAPSHCRRHDARKGAESISGRLPFRCNYRLSVHGEDTDRESWSHSPRGCVVQ